MLTWNFKCDKVLVNVKIVGKSQIKFLPLAIRLVRNLYSSDSSLDSLVECPSTPLIFMAIVCFQGQRLSQTRLSMQTGYSH